MKGGGITTVENGSNKHPGVLDHIVGATSMQEAPTGMRVSGYCAVLGCAPVTGTMPAAYERLSDHCSVIAELTHQDLD